MRPAYICEHFKLWEILPPCVYGDLEQRGILLIGWLLFDDRILRAADQLREEFGALTCNDWYSGGRFKGRGLRVPEMPEYRPSSQHSHGRALDLVSSTHDADVMRARILAYPEKYPGITRIESGVSWLHIDCANVKPIEIFRP